jgi:hypothetical protein
MLFAGGNGNWMNDTTWVQVFINSDVHLVLAAVRQHGAYDLQNAGSDDLSAWYHLVC